MEKCTYNICNSTRLNRFNYIVHRNGIIHIGYQGLPFTWHNKREGKASIFELPDRASVNQAWQDLYLIERLPITKSDHGPIVCIQIVREGTIGISIQIRGKMVPSRQLHCLLRSNRKNSIKDLKVFSFSRN